MVVYASLLLVQAKFYSDIMLTIVYFWGWDFYSSYLMHALSLDSHFFCLIKIWSELSDLLFTQQIALFCF